jgi:acetolactate synthase-1/2/3 large subunit
MPDQSTSTHLRASAGPELRTSDPTAEPAPQSVVESFAENLAIAGCERAYGLAGEDHVELMDALDGVGIRYVRAYNESSAVLMAAADAQVTGKVGVALVSMSAGMSNAVNGLTHALME